MKTSQEYPVAVKRVRRKTVSTSNAKRGRPPFVHFDDRHGKHWRIYFRLPEGITEVPKQLIVTSICDQHQLHIQHGGGGSTPVPVITQLVVATDPLAQLVHSGVLDAGNCDHGEFRRYVSGLVTK